MMNEQILNCISRPNHAEHIDKVLDNFGLDTLEDSGIRTADIKKLMRDAQKNLTRSVGSVSDPHYHSHLAVTKLGTLRKQKNETGDERAVYRMARHMSQIMCAYNEDITFSVVSRRESLGKLNTQFMISSEAKGKEPLVSMIRSAYGKAEVQMEHGIQLFPTRLYANGTPVFLGKKSGDRDGSKLFNRCESWITAILSSLPSSGNYTASVRFIPIHDVDGLKEKREILSRYNRKLRFYSDLNWSNNVNLGISISSGQNILQSIPGTDTDSHSAGYSLNLAGREINKEAALLADRIDHEIQWLNQAMESSVWAVQIIVSAEEMDTIQTLTSILTGTMAEAGIALNWSMDSRIEPMTLHGEEILPLMMFPTKEFSGFSFSENENFSLSSPGDDQQGVEIGNILWNGVPFSDFRLPPDRLNRHAFICGMTGAGKTNTMFGIITGLDVPFSVIEPVKGEYRALKSVYPDLKIWTMNTASDGKSGVEVMRINPFWFPRGGNLAYHVDSLKTIIASAFELSNAMPNILEQCLYNVYVKAGWDLVTNRNLYWDKVPEHYLYPTFSDLCNEVELYLNASDFSGDLMGDYKGALLSRLRSFVNGYKGILLDTNEHPDYGRLIHGHCVIELEGLADDADKCLVMGTILVQYYQVLKQTFQENTSSKLLTHLLVIEEAHRLFKNTANNKRTEGGANPTGQLVDLLSNMMAEIRAFGEGLLIVDQSPTKVSEDVIKNSATKIVHRIDNGNDIKALQSAMLLPDDILSFAALAQGEALIRMDGMEKPCKVKMHRSTVKDSYNLALSFRRDMPDISPLADLFLANSVLQKEETRQQVQEKIEVFLNSLVVCGMESWYSLVGELLGEILTILKNCRMQDAVDYRMNVLFEMISITLRNMYNGKNKLDFGQVHMMMMRLLAYYRDKREGRFIKPQSIELFQSYLDEHVAQIVKMYGMDYVDPYWHRNLCKLMDIQPEDIFSIMITNYIHDILPAVSSGREIPDGDGLLCSFLSTSVSFSALEKVLTASEKIFAELPEILKKLKQGE